MNTAVLDWVSQPRTRLAMFQVGWKHCFRSQYRSSSPPEDAEDIAHDSILRALELAATYDPKRGSIATWMHRIATTKAIDTKRKTWRRERNISKITTCDVVERGLNAGAQAAVEFGDTPALGMEFILNSVKALPPEQRDAFMALEVNGIHAKDYAASINSKRTTVAMRLGAAKKRLRVMLMEASGQCED